MKKLVLVAAVMFAFVGFANATNVKVQRVQVIQLAPVFNEVEVVEVVQKEVFVPVVQKIVKKQVVNKVVKQKVVKQVVQQEVVVKQKVVNKRRAVRGNRGGRRPVIQFNLRGGRR